MNLRTLITALALVASAGAAKAAEVTLRVTDVANGKGQLMASLCDAATFGKGRCLFLAQVAAKRGTVEVTFKKVPPGRWAAAVYHDENGNGTMDRNGLGIPLEGGGFSRDAKGKYGWPTFADAAVGVTADTVIPVSLNY